MKTLQTSLFPCSALAFAALSALTACSSAGDEAATSTGDGERVASSSAPLLNQADAQLTSDLFTNALSISNFYSSTVSYVASPPAAVFTPSPTLARLAKNSAGQPLGPQSLPIPPLSFNPGGAIGTLCAPFTVNFGGFGLTGPGGVAIPDLSGTTLAMNSQGIGVTGLAFNAVAQVTSGNPLACPSFDIAINGGTLSGTVGWDAGLQQFNVASVSANLPTTVSNCLFGACDSLVQNALPDLAALLESAVTSGLNGLFLAAQPQIQAAFGSVIVEAWSVIHAPSSGTPWVLGNVWGAANDIGFLPTPPVFSVYVTQTPIPPAPRCTYSAATCGDQVIAYCTADGSDGSDPIDIFQVINGQRTEIGQLPMPTNTTMTLAQFVAAYDNGATSGAFLGCTVNAAGQTCDPAPTTITFNGPCSTGPVGTGGGGGGGSGYGGPSGCVGRCIQ